MSYMSYILALTFNIKFFHPYYKVFISNKTLLKALMHKYTNRVKQLVLFTFYSFDLSVARQEILQ